MKKLQLLNPVVFVMVLLAICLGSGMDANAARCWQQEVSEPDGDEPDGPRAGKLVRVQLPITSDVAKQVQQTIDRLAEQAPVVVKPSDRMQLVLEFDTAGGKTGRGSEFGACFELARYLSSASLSRVKTIAYIPGPKGYFDPGQNERPASFLSGHAVLVAIAANEIVMHEDAAIGEAGIDEEAGDESVTSSYQAIAKRRLTLPVSVVMSMVDPSRRLYRVSTNEGVVYVGADEQAKLEASGSVVETNTLSRPGELARFSSQELLDFRLIRRSVSSTTELARQLDLSPNALEGDPTMGKKWDAVAIPLPEYVSNESVQWVSRALDKREPNLIIFRVNGLDADPEAVLQLAQKVAQYDTNQVRTVAFVESELRGPGVWLALSCDHVLMAPGAELFGPGDQEYDDDTKELYRGLLSDLASKLEKDWSLFMAALDPQLAVNRYRNASTGQLRLLSATEHEALEDSDAWVLLGPLPTAEGIDAELAEQLFIARSIVADMDSVQTFYQLESSPEVLQPTITDQWVKRIADTLSSPLIAPWLMLGAFFFLSTEMSAPGIGVPGFLGALCLMLFFWSQYLGGNAHWLEILLFFVGVVFILIEVFAVPGFGVFGVGGIIMVVCSIVLASQTFIVPRNTEELARLPYSLLPLVGAGTGLGVAFFTLRNVLPNTPYLKRMMLQPRSGGVTTKGIEEDPEAIVDWSHLVGRNGETVTRLFPAGKARIAGKVYDVISDGRMIDKGTPVEVAEVLGNRVLVQPVEPE